VVTNQLNAYSDLEKVEAADLEDGRKYVMFDGSSALVVQVKVHAAGDKSIGFVRSFMTGLLATDNWHYPLSTLERHVEFYAFSESKAMVPA
jgi:hypothetical protein